MNIKYKVVLSNEAGHELELLTSQDQSDKSLAKVRVSPGNDTFTPKSLSNVAVRLVFIKRQSLSSYYLIFLFFISRIPLFRDITKKDRQHSRIKEVLTKVKMY